MCRWWNFACCRRAESESFYFIFFLSFNTRKCSSAITVVFLVFNSVSLQIIFFLLRILFIFLKFVSKKEKIWKLWENQQFEFQTKVIDIFRSTSEISFFILSKIFQPFFHPNVTDRLRCLIDSIIKLVETVIYYFLFNFLCSPYPFYSLRKRIIEWLTTSETNSYVRFTRLSHWKVNLVKVKPEPMKRERSSKKKKKRRRNNRQSIISQHSLANPTHYKVSSSSSSSIFASACLSRFFESLW